MYSPFSFPLTGGFDRSVATLRADKGTFYTLQNFRQSRTSRGAIEQTPRFYLFGTQTQGTYWNGSASTTEPSESAIRFWDGTLGLTLTEYCAWNTSSATQLKVIKQISQPTGTGVTKGCLLTLVTPASITVTLGNTYDIEIDGATTFRWRVNGGGWTSLVAINLADGNLIDGGAVRVYWLASSGFTVADAWSFSRTDFTNAQTSPGMLVEILRINDLVYYIDFSNRLYVIDLTVGYVRTVGYRSVYATSVFGYENHLFLTNAGEAATGENDLWCSDLNDLDCFTPTDVNEADVFNLPLEQRPTSLISLVAESGCVQQGRAYVLTNVGIFFADYAGLPVPFSFTKLIDLNKTAASRGRILACKSGIFVLTDNVLYQLNGADLKQLVDLTAHGISSFTGFFFNDRYSELIVTYSGSILVYQCLYGTAYTRSVHFSAFGPTGVNCTSGGLLNFGDISRRKLAEDSSFANTPVSDATSGTTKATPTLVTHLLDSNSMAIVKEEASLFLTAVVGSSGGVNYSVSANNQVEIKYYLSSSGSISGSPTTGSTWISTKPDGKLDIRVSYRAIAFQLTLSGLDGTKPPGAFTLTSLETIIYQPNATR